MIVGTTAIIAAKFLLYHPSNQQILSGPAVFLSKNKLDQLSLRVNMEMTSLLSQRPKINEDIIYDAFNLSSISAVAMEAEERLKKSAGRQLKLQNTPSSIVLPCAEEEACIWKLSRRREDRFPEYFED
nr:unnamed protein product [Callosobruchus chinensis]